MKLVMCLGNPGREYENTRHNAGFMFADMLANKMSCNFVNESKFKAHIAKFDYEGNSVWIVKPQTFMNLSGEAFNAITKFYKTDIKNLLLVYDDIDLEIGRIRFRAKGSSGGHNGVKSIIHFANSENFDRLKIGIGEQPPFIKAEDFVLQNFSKEQKEIMDKTLQSCIDAFFYYLSNGIEKVQNKYN